MTTPRIKTLVTQSAKQPVETKKPSERPPAMMKTVSSPPDPKPPVKVPSSSSTPKPEGSSSPGKVTVKVLEDPRPTVVSKQTGVKTSSLQLSTTSSPSVSPQPTRPVQGRVERVNVSRLLGIRGFSNHVDIQVNDVKISCSGAILAYHSPFFEYQLSRGVGIINLEELKCPRGQECLAEECLLLLYGGGVILSDRNIITILRFSVLYQVDNMYRLAMEWVRNCIGVHNVYAFWTLAQEPCVAMKRTRKKDDLVHVCKTFLAGHEVEVAVHVRDLNRYQGVMIREDFLLLLMQMSGCATIVTDVISCLKTAD